MACNNCKDNEQIPHHSKEELAFAFSERMVKRLWIALIICICFIFASNAAWLYCWMQYDYESYSYDVSADGDSDANFIGQDGNIYNGSENFGTEENP